MHNECYRQIQDPNILLGELLVQLTVITRDQLTIALQEQRTSGRLLGEELLYLGFVEEKPLLSLLAVRFNLPVLTDPLLTIVPSVLSCMRIEEIDRYQAFPIALDTDTQHLMIAVSTIQDESVFDQLSQYNELTVFLTSQRIIQEAMSRHYLQHTLDRLSMELEWDEPAPLLDDTSIIIRFVQALLTEAIRLKASDLHCEPEAAWINLRYRIDGVLRIPRQLHRRHWSALSVRLKLLAGLDIAETRANQDGRLRFVFAAREVDCRVSVVPTIHGENIVIRFLDHAAQIFTLECLGFTFSQQQLIARILNRPYGMTLVAGPTGSGKTTTLYTLLQQFNWCTHNIMTLEDPVEYRLPGIRQISLHALTKMSFASGVRALLRQAPDIILIGEIRDSETAYAAFQASMTGHRVLASVHAKSAMGAITRLLELGVPRAHIAANVAGLIGQRLVRRLCAYCKAPTPIKKNDRMIWQAVGCAQCTDSGFTGRIVVSEVVYVDTVLEALIPDAASEAQLRFYQQQSGIPSLYDDAHDKLYAGMTSDREIQRVIDIEQEVPRAI